MNPLTRWSRGLRKLCEARLSQDLRYPELFVGLEGCRSAFNATNALRTCLFFGCQPPTFLGIKSLDDIDHLEQSETIDSPSGDIPLAYFGDFTPPFASTAHRSPMKNTVVCMENYVERAVSIDTYGFPMAMSTGSALGSTSLIIGHENDGVSQSRLQSADDIIFIPQFGTISSLNVVTTLGLGLFHYHLDQRGSRSMRVAPSLSAEQYFSAFSSPKHGDVKEDLRPIHPSYFKLSHEEILRQHEQHVQKIEKQRCVKISVLYENDFDQRNLGGLIRVCNAFLADVHYVGRKKINVQGAVGTHLYTQKHHYAEPNVFVDHKFREGQTVLCFLSCEHDFLFSDQECGSTDEEKLVYEHGLALGMNDVHLDSPDSELKAVLASVVGTASELIIVVPQEGKLPSAEILARCSCRLRILTKDASPCIHRGIPSQTASGIALQRILSIFVQN